MLLRVRQCAKSSKRDQSRDLALKSLQFSREEQTLHLKAFNKNVWGTYYVPDILVFIENTKPNKIWQKKRSIVSSWVRKGKLPDKIPELDLESSVRICKINEGRSKKDRKAFLKVGTRSVNHGGLK